MQATRDFSHYVRHLGSGLSHIDLAVEGVNCAGCMSKIERGLSALPDVTLARVNLTDRRVALEWKEGALDPARFIDRLAELGYKAYPFEPIRAEAVETEQASFLLRCLGVAAFAAMNIMMLSIPVWSGNVSDMIPEQRDFFHWLSALIALPASRERLRRNSSAPMKSASCRLPPCRQATSFCCVRASAPPSTAP